MDLINKMVERFLKANRRLKRWQRAVSVMAAVVVFATTYAFILPAVTLDKETASEQSGIEIAASDNESDSSGTVYEAEPEEEPQDEELAEPQDEESEETRDEHDAEAVTEDSSSESEKVEADISEEDNTDQDTEAADGQSAEKQTGSKKAEDSHDDLDAALDAADADDPASETLVEGGTAEEIKLITEKTQLTYEYIDEFYEDGIDDENDDGIDDGYFVFAEFGADAKLPEGVELSVKEITKESDPEAYEAYYEKALSGLQDKYDENTALSFARFYDIKFVYNGKEVEPAGDVKVRIEYKKAVEIEKETNVDAVHFDKNNDEEPEVIDSEVEAEKKGKDDAVKTVEFESDQFSVYGIIGSYTVDFSYVVNGKTYEFSIPGGGFITLQQLVEVLGISNGDAYNAEADGSDSAAEKQSVNRFAAYLGVEISDKTKEFVADVENVEFSDSGLVWLGKVDENSTVGALKEANGLDVQYSTELTEEQITDINAQTVESGDWALVSVQPFTSEESLTVTMKNGESFTIMVTDAQISTHVITADGEGFVITVTYDESAEIPDGAELYAEEIPGDTQEFDQLFQDTEAAYEKTIKEGSVEDARFFDVKIRYGDVPIEPKAPVQVSIQYDYEIAPTEENELYIVHFAEKGTEIISDLSFEEEGTKVLYVQSGFSVIGTVTTSTVNSNNWPDAGDYVLILSTGDGSSGYYAVDQTGVLAPVEYDAVNRTVTFSNANEVSELGGYIWTHEVAGTNHRLTNNLGEPKQYMTLTDSTVMSTSTGISLAINSGYITVGRASNRYYLAMDFHNHIVVSHQAVNNGNGNISYPENPAYVAFVSTDSLRVDTHTNPYSGRQWDKEVLEEWIERLESRKPPLDGLDKTAEVYDYENRIYQIDLQAKSGVDTFVNDIDISFMLDFSNSMLFPSSLTSVNASAILTQDNLNNLVNQGVLDRNQVYVVIGDKNGTATNYAVYVYDYNSDTTSDKAGQQQTLQGFNGKWVVYDASFYAKTRARVNGYQSIATDGRWRIPTALPTNNASNFRIDAVDGYNFVYSFYTPNETFFTGMTRSAIYSTESPGYNRLYYLKDGVKDSIRNIIQIALKDTNMTTKTVRTAYNLFWGNVGASQDFLEVTNAEGATNNYEELVRLLEQGITDGGTRQDLAMQSAGTNFSWNTSATKYAILITDGAPLQNGVSTDQLNNQLIAAANALKNQGITLITVGISMNEVTNGQYILHEIASRDSNGEPYFYEIMSAEDLKYVLYDILQKMMAEATVRTEFVDKIDEAFYPVAKDGTPLRVGDKINLYGELTTDTSQPYGIIGYDSDQNVFTVTWDDQAVTWDGWNGTVFVKSKEDFLGGNTINTNKGDATAVAESYTVSGLDSQGKTISSTVDLSNMDLNIRSYYLETPYVNVDELSLTNHSSEWTVYVGTGVDPFTQICGLYDGIDVREVVSPSTTNHMMTNKNQILGGTSDESETFRLSTITGDFATIVSGLTADEKAAFLSGTPISIPYDNTVLSTYGHGDVGTIQISLTKSEFGDFEEHIADTTGQPRETYTLNVKYIPTTETERDTELEIDTTAEDPYHNGDGEKGEPTGEMTSSNTHVINVIDKSIQIVKVDANGNPITTGSATFKLYKKDSEGAAVEGLPEGKYTEVSELTTTAGTGLTAEEILYPIVNDDNAVTNTYTIGSKTYKKYYVDNTEYYLLETSAPASYTKYNQPVKVELGIEETKTPVIVDSSNNVLAYNWNQAATVTIDDSSNYVTVDASGKPIKISVRNDKSAELEIIKTDNADTPKEIGGAIFTLSKDHVLLTDLTIKDKNGNSVAVDATTGRFTIPEGGVTIKDLLAGDYVLSEVESPPGYIKTIQDIVFTVDVAGEITDTANELNAGMVEFVEESETYKIKNESGAALPMTGGPGTNLIYLIGLTFTAFAGAGLVMKKRRRKNVA